MENPILVQLNWRYETFLKCLDTEKLDFKAYYNSIYEYIDVIEKRSEFQKIIEADAQAIKDQVEKIEADKSIDQNERKELVQRIKDFSFSDRYDYVRKKIYLPMHEYMHTGKKNLVGAVLTNDWPYDGFGTSMFGAGVFYVFGAKDKAKMEIINFQYHDNIRLFKEHVQRLHTVLTNVIIGLQESVLKEADRVQIVIDEKNGIYQSGNEQAVYAIGKRSKRFKLIKYLLSKDDCRLSELEEVTKQDDTVVMNAVPEINRLFRKNTGLVHDLILHNDTSGYSLNKQAFDIVLEQ
jgi:hypothetical protein